MCEAPQLSRSRSDRAVSTREPPMCLRWVCACARWGGNRQWPWPVRSCLNSYRGPLWSGPCFLVGSHFPQPPLLTLSSRDTKPLAHWTDPSFHSCCSPSPHFIHGTPLHPPFSKNDSRLSLSPAAPYTDSIKSSHTVCIFLIQCLFPTDWAFDRLTG